ncbi:MAG TPA: hypothetical protein VF988_11075 [Verrucomicrobiae bacterium]
MNNLPGVNETLALLDALKKNVRDFAAREEKLESDFRVATANELRDFTARNQTLEGAAMNNDLDSAAALKAGQDQCQEWFERRKAWINRAHANVSRAILGKIGEDDTLLKDRTQQGVQQAEARRDAALASAAATHESFQQQLASAGEQVAQLEASAHSAFRGYGKLRRWLAAPADATQPSATEAQSNHLQLFDELQKLQSKIAKDLTRFGDILLPKLFKFLPVWLLVVIFLAVAVADPVLAHLGKNVIPHAMAIAALVALVVVVALYFIGGSSAAAPARAIATDLARARRLFDLCHERSAAFWQSEQERLRNEFEETKRAVNLEWKQATRGISARRGEAPAKLAEKVSRISTKCQRQYNVRLEQVQKRHNDALAQFKVVDRVKFDQLAAAHKARMSQLETEHQQRWQQMEADWKNTLQPLCEQLRNLNDAADKLCPD